MEKIKCEDCGRKIYSGFLDKTEHILQYHPERVFKGLVQFNVLDHSRSLGERIAKAIKGVE